MGEIFVADCQRFDKKDINPEQYLKDYLKREVEIVSIERDWSVRGYIIQYEEK